MSQQNKRKSARIKNLIIVCTFTAVILSVSTYAWFIGMRTVNVSSFDVEIAATDSLLLSLNGTKWDTTVYIDKDNINTYPGNTNWWAGKGLFPVSSVGDMDITASRMILFEKASLTATSGGYRLMASRVHNYEVDHPEQEGYVAFDLFVKNFSGNQYIKGMEPKDEEAIYLTVDSDVKVAVDGVPNTGIENSVRVAFGQIGRVIGTTTDQATITGITCTSSPDDGPVTGLCRTAQIWEPNDKNHEANAISWYAHSCKARKAGVAGADVTSVDSYDGTCNEVVNDATYPTYAVKGPIYSSDNVDVYDGTEYNKYAGTSNTLLYPYPYFTDSMKIKKGTDRPPFMTLAPNSITKVRVYIYIEGQDVDNYDFASIGKKIAVKFGFTKERYIETDIEYNGPDLGPIKDSVKPVITMNPADSEVPGVFNVTITQGEEYTDAGATANDNVDGVITAKIIKTGTVDVNTVGTYTITYNVEDRNGNHADSVTRTVTVQAP